jgi:putative mycofactocin binding protein MftB
LSITDERAVATEQAFDPDRPWRIHPQVALRDESFGALAYHYGTRRLLFLKSRQLVDVVRALEQFESATAAIEALVTENERTRYTKALSRLAISEVIDAR